MNKAEEADNIAQGPKQIQSMSQLSLEKRNDLYRLHQLARQHNPDGWYAGWDDSRLVDVEDMTKSLLHAVAIGLSSPAIQAMMSASGLTKEQAKTCVYYAVATFLRNDYAELFPILLFQGNSGTGKSQAMNQMEKLVNEPRRVQGRTYSEVGRNLDGAVTAIIDEGDFKQDKVETELLQLRCCQTYANQTIHIPPEQRPLNIFNFGATVIARRTPFTDTATRNRTITVKTKRRPGAYRIVDINCQGTRTLAGIIQSHRVAVGASDRVSDSWRPVTEVC